MTELKESNFKVVGFRVKNTHNYIWNDYSTKKVYRLNQLYAKIITTYHTFDVNDPSFEFGCEIGSLSFPEVR